MTGRAGSRAGEGLQARQAGRQAGTTEQRRQCRHAGQGRAVLGRTSRVGSVSQAGHAGETGQAGQAGMAGLDRLARQGSSSRLGM